MRSAFPKVIKTFTKLLVFSWIAVFLFIPACDNDSTVEGVPEKEFYRTGNAADEGTISDSIRTTDFGPVALSDHPINDALSLLHLNMDMNYRRPAYEEGYIMLARLPLIDTLSQSPFKLQGWADEMSHALQNSASRGLNDTFSVIADALGGNEEVYLASGNRPQHNTDLFEAYLYLCQTFGWTPHETDLNNLKNVGFSVIFDRHLGLLTHHLTDAAVLATEAYSDLSSKELERLRLSPERFFFPHDAQFNFLTAPTHVQVEIVSIVRKINFDKLFAAFDCVAKAVNTFRLFVDQGTLDSSLAARIFSDEKIRSGTVLTLPSPIGDIVFLGQDDNVFHGSGALVIDLGGNDRYTGEIGLGPTINGRMSVSVDLAGDDRYGRADSKSSQGVGIASIGLLADFGGDDRYVAGDMAQGCGIFGIGALWDTRGNDVYEMGLMGQGFGVFGIGLLTDRSGNDQYTIGGMGQGAGSTMGFGALIDGDGDDVYRAEWSPERSVLTADDWSHAQGAGLSIRSPDWRRNFSLYGGIGFLSDGSGDDSYHCSGGNCMGSAYFMSVGSLVDHSGNDRYFPMNGNGMGFAVHLASGIFIDKGGNDQYLAKKDSGGVGADRSVGMLVDYQGDDLYGPVSFGSKSALAEHDRNTDNDQTISSKTPHDYLALSSYASASRSKGFGFLIDYSGNDRYFAQRGHRSASCGAVIPPPEPHNWSHAVLIDLGGTDVHNSNDRKNNSYRIDLSHGLFYDVDLQDGIDEIQGLPYGVVIENQGNATLPKTLLPAFLKDEVLPLAGDNNFLRFSSIGRIVKLEPEIINAMVDVLSVSRHGELNHSLIEALNHYILQKEMTRDRTRHFEALLKANDPEVRTYAARTLGWWGVINSIEAVVAAVNDPDPEVRAHVYWAVGRLGRFGHLKVLREAVSSETSGHCKQEAVRAYHAILANKDIDDPNIHHEAKEALLLWAKDTDPIIRRDAAIGLRFIGLETEVIQSLTALLQDSDVYVKRATAISLTHLGKKEGIPVLIESLTFPSIDTREHYDQDLVKELAFFCGTDFTEELRYDHEIWREWWRKNEGKVDIKENLTIMKEIESAFESDNEKVGLVILERLLARHPENVVIKSRTIRFCKDWITFRLLARDSIDREVLERCLQLQKKLVEIEPNNPNSVSTLAGYYARLGRLDDATTAMKTAIHLDPGNAHYLKLLSYYESYK